METNGPTVTVAIYECGCEERHAGELPSSCATHGEKRAYTYKINPAAAKPDLVNHPPHYTAHPSGIECIQVTEWMNFNLGNAVKYLWRADLKGGVEDLKKALWYVQRELTRLETQRSKT